MREPYLLAASLLTGLAIPASALPQMSSITPEEPEFLGDIHQGSQSFGGENIIPSVDVSLPEFSNQAVSLLGDLPSPLGEDLLSSVDTSLPKFKNQIWSELKNSQLPLVENLTSKQEISLPGLSNEVWPITVDSSNRPDFSTSNRSLATGNQLYYQRLASLKTGQIYTRVDNGNSQSLWELADKHKLTYEDWKSLLVMEARAIAKGQGKNRLSILVGDSLSMWFPKEKLPSGKLWLNQGISGDSSAGVLRRLSAFNATRPEIIYIMVGINDLRKGNSDESILTNYHQIINRLRKAHPSTQIVVLSILPVRLTTISNSHIRHLNTQLALLAKQQGANYLDIHRWFTDFEGNLRPELTTDGLHLSPQGYDVWRIALQQIEYKIAGR
ncbi:MAG TPA: SGNH/GDSL hydrolase family protein [Nostocaceae cyanobacterium]|nr:SGNH/GDSL hydrolase family protein [Nostocaceae cyanobacterium]